jgi:hypothetical protein
LPFIISARVNALMRDDFTTSTAMGKTDGGKIRGFLLQKIREKPMETKS